MKIKILLITLICFTAGISAALFLNDTSSTKPKVLIGGPFSLMAHTGERVSEKDFKGKLTLMYFGYSHCPDVCPGDLQVMANALDELGSKVQNINAVFVSIDPERDTAETLGNYLDYFHKKIVGLTGTKQEIQKIAKAYRIYYARVEAPDSGVKYLMNHSAITYLMDKNGSYLTHFNHGTDPKQMVARISKYL
ncbi:MAG: SCO family protein [Pseudomonadota bacterium]